MANFNSTVPVSQQIDIELFEWSANEGRANRYDSFPIATKEQFMDMPAIRHITDKPLLTDMYRAYRTGYTQHPIAVVNENKESV